MTQVALLKEITKARTPVATVAVSSGKGGVGKTTISVCLSKFLADAGERVCLVDGDLGLANVDILLGLSSKLNLYHIAVGEAKLEDVLVEVTKGFYVLPGGSGIRQLLSMTRQMRERIASEFLKLDGMVDYIIADTAAGIADEVLLFCVSCADTMLVVTPEPTSMTDAYALLKILNKDYGRKEFKVIVNMVEGPEDSVVFSHLETVSHKFLQKAKLVKVGEIPKNAVFSCLIREQSLSLLDSVRDIFGPVVERMLDGKVFAKQPLGLSRLAMGFLRYKGVSQGD